MNKRITMATIKSFVRKAPNLHIRYHSSFDGMTDSVEFYKEPRPVVPVRASDAPSLIAHDLGIAGAWFVGHSRDSFSPIFEGEWRGYHVYNCCGSFDLLVKV